MKIAVLGAGAWGTALAIHFAAHGHTVSLWTRSAEHAAQMHGSRENRRYLAGLPLPAALTVHSNMAEAVSGADLLLAAVPVAALRGCMQAVNAAGGGDIPVLAACKGFEPNSGLLPFQVLEQVLPANPCVGVLSGPSFAQELAQGLPCAVCLASANGEWIGALAAALNTEVLRLYANSDVVGVCVGGAVKNVMAVAAGLSDGLGCGMNARAALMTRGLAEMTRLAVALGAQAKTLMGLSGMGDLLLTCTGGLSRNRQVGLALAEGRALADILADLGHVAEGIPAIAEVHHSAQRLGVNMPVTAALADLLDGRIAAADIAARLMQREPTAE